MNRDPLMTPNGNKETAADSPAAAGTRANVTQGLPLVLLAPLALVIALATGLGAFLSVTALRKAADADTVGFVAADPQAAPLPEFSLMERSGQPLERAALAGKVVIVGFIFTRCGDTCPMITAAMAQLREQLPATVQLLSLSVDPRYDRPEILRDYAARFEADPTTWWFATGDVEAMYKLIQQGFKLSVGENPDPKVGEMILHTTRLALVNRDGRVVAYYDARRPELLDRLRRDALALVREN